jgi:hypothetical protein
MNWFKLSCWDKVLDLVSIVDSSWLVLIFSKKLIYPEFAIFQFRILITWPAVAVAIFRAQEGTPSHDQKQKKYNTFLVDLDHLYQKRVDHRRKYT